MSYQQNGPAKWKTTGRAVLYFPYIFFTASQIKVSLVTFFSKESYAQIFSKRWARLREKQRTMPITAPMPACKISNGNLMMAYSGVL